MGIILLLISLIASVIGGICGIGGGVLIKPVLELFGAVPFSQIGFLSSCTVLTMSLYNVARSFADRSGGIDTKTGTPLAIGAALGGICGNLLFNGIRAAAGNDNIIGAVQAICLLLLTAGTLLYTLNKAKIKPLKLQHGAICTAIGLCLGFLSSFLGIGGGPFNLVILQFLFGMDTKHSVSNSLYIILFSQIANLLLSLLAGSIPDFEISALLWMVLGGIGGGILGRSIQKKLDSHAVDKLFTVLLTVIMVICVYNTVKYFQ